MKKLWLLVCFWLCACTGLPPVQQLPSQSQAVRLFKVEQLDAQQQPQQTSLLTLQTAPTEWRWVQTDALGAPLARLLLKPQGWQNDGFVAPNRQAQWLFSALATALNPQQPLFNFSQIQRQPNGTDYFIGQQKVWRIAQSPQQMDIWLADKTHWRVQPVNQ